MKKSEEILRAARRVYRKLTALDFRKADLDLFRDLLPEIWLFRDHLQKAAYPENLDKNTRKLCSCVNKKLLDKVKTNKWKLRENGNDDR